MQLFDSLTFLTLLIILGYKYIKPENRPTWTEYLLLVALVFSFLQILIEGFRWQLVPATSVLIALLLQVFWRTSFSKRDKDVGKWPSFKRIFGASLASLLVLTSIVFSYAFPMFDLPEPTGKYAVGTTEFHMIDETRLETYTKNPDDKRELMVRAWYPALPNASDQSAPYWDHAMARSNEMTKSMGVPNFLLSHLGQIGTHSFLNSPIAGQQASYPVLIFSHGYGLGSATSNTHLMESLASHGYIIFSIDHAYVGMGSIFPDGRVASFNEEVFKSVNEPPTDEVSEIYEAVESNKNWREQIELLKKADKLLPEDAALVLTDALRIWAADQMFVLSQIEKLQNGETLIPSINSVEFKGKLDTENLGLFGMSFGGSTSLQNCVLDKRCKAGINMDGFLIEQVQLPALNRPFMFMNNDNSLFFNAMYEVANDDVYAVTIEGSLHGNFTDGSITSPLYKMIGIVGEIDGVKMLNITDDYVRSFFDYYLKNQDSSLLNSQTIRYPEVIFKVKYKH